MPIASHRRNHGNSRNSVTVYLKGLTMKPNSDNVDTSAEAVGANARLLCSIESTGYTSDLRHIANLLKALLAENTALQVVTDLAKRQSLRDHSFMSDGRPVICKCEMCQALAELKELPHSNREGS